MATAAASIALAARPAAAPRGATRARRAVPAPLRQAAPVRFPRARARGPAPAAAIAEPSELLTASVRLDEDGNEALRFLRPEAAREVAKQYGTPAYVYDMATLRAQASAALAFPNPFGLTVRFAMKAAPNAAVLKLFHSMGLHIDASSGYEVRRAMAAGFAAEQISLSTQELPTFFAELLQQGVKLNACSLEQLERYGQAFPGAEVGLRVNPGLGSGGTGRTNVGGPASSFGIWHELLPQAKEIVAKYDLKVVRIHTHIGSGSDPTVWQRVANLNMDTVKQFPDVVTLNMGGGYKVARMSTEKNTDLQVIGAPAKEALEAFAEETGRKLHLEIEPGTFLLANACSVLSTVQDMTSTGAEGHTFLKLDAGMTDVLRPSIYGAQHPLVVVKGEGNSASGVSSYVVVGHCCESGDILTPGPDDPEAVTERKMKTAEVGDLLVIEGSGAYCSSMSTKNYNSYPEIPEVMLDTEGNLHCIRKRQTLEQILENEMPLPDGLL
eukprot:jgi/Tetstr1/438847/TSEL_027356.t1